ncbi:hypothetical protein EV426DRAFT_123865 [Tirmania nivea]|nr:hypothetical protein EV426DRAFT_123865 [Tirmania nivea]
MPIDRSRGIIPNTIHSFDASHLIEIINSFWHNVYFHDASAPAIRLGGLIQNGSVTEANFLHMLGILMVFDTPIRVRERSSCHVVSTANYRVELGEYDIFCGSPIRANDEPWVKRLISFNVMAR